MVECIGVFAEFHRSSGRTKPLIAFVQIVEKAFQCIVVEPSKKIASGSNPSKPYFAAKSTDSRKLAGNPIRPRLRMEFKTYALERSMIRSMREVSIYFNWE